MAAGLGIRHVSAEVLPSGKADQVRRCPGCGRVGVNAERRIHLPDKSHSTVLAVPAAMTRIVGLNLKPW